MVPMDNSRQLPIHIRTKEDVANFFAYLMLIDNLILDPNAAFSEYETEGESPVFTKAEASDRDILMVQAFRIARKQNLDIEEIALYVTALADLDRGYLDPRVKKEAPAWLKRVMKGWEV